jgi:prepilin-type N-terminal cleavage/methylation domain-containing protein
MAVKNEGRGGTMQNRNGFRKDQAGFTIIELMIALLVLTLMIGSYVGANAKAQRNTEEMNERTVALQDANRVIERMRAASNTEDWHFPADTVTAYPNGGTVAGITNLTDELITVTYTTAEVGKDPTKVDPLHVTTTVTWKSYAGREHTEAVETYITQRG